MAAWVTSKKQEQRSTSVMHALLRFTKAPTASRRLISSHERCRSTAEKPLRFTSTSCAEPLRLSARAMRRSSVKPRRALVRLSTASNDRRAGCCHRNHPTRRLPVRHLICACSATRPEVVCSRRMPSPRCGRAMEPHAARSRAFLPRTLLCRRAASSAQLSTAVTASTVPRRRSLNRDRQAMSLKGKTLFITGGSRGIGLAIALKAASEGANVALAAKTVEPHPKLEGTIHTAAAEVAKAGGRALPLAVDVRDEAAVQAAIDEAAEKFGSIDIVVNNASAIQLTSVAATDMRRYDLMQQINARGTFMVSKFAIPYLTRAANPHILMLSPPLDMSEKWFAPHTAYSMAKFGMSLVVLGLAGELRGKVAVNALWPRTTIATAAIRNLLGGDTMMRRSRKPEILAEAACRIFEKPKSFTGNFLIDDTFLASEGVTDFDQYRVDPSQPLQIDFFVPDSSQPPSGVSLDAKSR